MQNDRAPAPKSQIHVVEEALRSADKFNDLETIAKFVLHKLTLYGYIVAPFDHHFGYFLKTLYETLFKGGKGQISGESLENLRFLAQKAMEMEVKAERIKARLDTDGTYQDIEIVPEETLDKNKYRVKVKWEPPLTVSRTLQAFITLEKWVPTKETSEPPDFTHNFTVTVTKEGIHNGTPSSLLPKMPVDLREKLALHLRTYWNGLYPEEGLETTIWMNVPRDEDPITHEPVKN